MATTHDEMIEKADVDKLERCFETPGDALVSFAGLGNAGAMVVLERCTV